MHTAHDGFQHKLSSCILSTVPVVGGTNLVLPQTVQEPAQLEQLRSFYCASGGWRLQVHVLALAAQAVADSDGISCELLDLRSLLPWDVAAVTGSVQKTGRLLVSHEAPLTGGFGAELVAEVTRRCFLSLEAPPVRVSEGQVVA